MKQFFLLLLIVCLSSSCKDKYDAEEQHMEDVIAIETFLTSNNIDYQKTEGDVFFYVTDIGNNDGNPTIESTVDCNYTGFLFDDFAEEGVLRVFDRTNGIAVSFPLTRVIRGWQEGIPELSRNASGRFFIPSTLAYGSQGQNGIGRNEILVFDITLVHYY